MRFNLQKHNKIAHKRHTNEHVIQIQVQLLLAQGIWLGTPQGPGPKRTIDVAAGAKGSSFNPFGTWAITLP